MKCKGKGKEETRSDLAHRVYSLPLSLRFLFGITKFNFRQEPSSSLESLNVSAYQKMFLDCNHSSLIKKQPN